MAANGKAKVIVTGAAGRTGRLVFKKLLSSPYYTPLGIVRTKGSQEKLLKEAGGDRDQVIVSDITSSQDLQALFQGADSVILCTSATPKIKILSLIKVMLLKVIGQSGRPEFTFPENGSPYNVDWLGAKNQIDAAKAAGVKQFVVVSSMGGTQPDHFLNTIGRVEGDEKSGNILIWKRKAENYLIDSGLPYTIVHAGGLIDKAGGQAQVIMGFDDTLLQRPVRSIPREDVAEVCVQALGRSQAKKRSFDVIADATVGQVTNWDAFFAQPGNSKHP
eukprot:gene6171-6799_t